MPITSPACPEQKVDSVQRNVLIIGAGGVEKIVEIELDDRDLDVVVDADSHRLEQVVSNLLDNARKHGGTVAPIGVRVARSKRGMAQILVTDQGQGISAVDQRRIFERFFVAANSVTRNGGGAGLGLYICNQLVTAMGGTIDVRSRVGEGATFIIELPIRAESLRSNEPPPSVTPLSLKTELAE